MTNEAQSVAMAKLEICKGPDAEVTVGGLRFVACRREVGDIDGGITLYVWGRAPGEDEVEILRMDLFRDRPHYHAPAEKQEETRIEAEDAVAWGIDALTTHAASFADEAGYGAIGANLDGAALAGAEPLLRGLFAGLEEPNEVSYFEVPQAVLDQLSAS